MWIKRLTGNNRGFVVWSIWAIFAISFLGMGTLILALFGLPYQQAKPIGDFLARDGNLEAFSQEFHTAWRMVWIVGAGCLAAFTGMVVQREKTLGQLTKQVERTKTAWQGLVSDSGEIWRSFQRIFANRWELAFLLGLVLVSILNKVVLLSKPMGHDEAYTVMAFAVRPLRFLIADYHLPNNHIFHTILVHLSLWLGKGPWIVRLPAFLTGVLLTPASYLTARLMFRRRWIARLAAVLVSVVPVLSSFSANARGYTLLCLFTLIALAAAHFVRLRDNRAGWGVLTLASVLGFYTIPIMAYPAGMVYGWLFLSGLAGNFSAGYGGRWHFFKRLTVSGLSSALAVLVLYTPVFLVSGVKSVVGNSFVAPLSWGRFTAGLLTHWGKTWEEWGGEVPAFAVGVSVVCFVIALGYHKKLTRQVIPFPLAALGWTAALLYYQRVAPVSRIWLFVLPLYLLYVAAGGVFLLDKLLTLGRTKSTLRTGIFMVLFSVILLWSMSGALRQSQGVKTQPLGKMELLTLALCDTLQPGDKVLVDTTNAPALWYYFFLHGLPDAFYGQDEAISFRKIYIVVDESEKETLESVIERQHFNDIIDQTTIRPVYTQGRVSLYLAQPVPAYQAPNRSENLLPEALHCP